MNIPNHCRFSNLDTGEIQERWLESLSDDPVQDLNELLINVLRDAICDAAVYGFGRCTIEYVYNNGNHYTNTFNDFNELKQFYRHFIRTN